MRLRMLWSWVHPWPGDPRRGAPAPAPARLPPCCDDRLRAEQRCLGFCGHVWAAGRDAWRLASQGGPTKGSPGCSACHASSLRPLLVCTCSSTRLGALPARDACSPVVRATRAQAVPYGAESALRVCAGCAHFGCMVAARAQAFMHALSQCARAKCFFWEAQRAHVRPALVKFATLLGHR
jgi:hypothetical protein